jgi:hypothetical protein
MGVGGSGSISGRATPRPIRATPRPIRGTTVRRRQSRGTEDEPESCWSAALPTAIPPSARAMAPLAVVRGAPGGRVSQADAPSLHRRRQPPMSDIIVDSHWGRRHRRIRRADWLPEPEASPEPSTGSTRESGAAPVPWLGLPKGQRCRIAPWPPQDRSVGCPAPSGRSPIGSQAEPNGFPVPSGSPSPQITVV